MPSWIIVSYLICFAAIIFAIVRLFARGNKPYAKAGVMVYLVYTLLFAAIWIFSLPVPAFLIFLTMLTALAYCFCGYYLDLYNHSPYVFDRSLHAFGAFSFSLTAYCIIAGVTQPGGSLLFRALFVFCIGNTLGAVFELLEAAHDSKKMSRSRDKRAFRIRIWICCLMQSVRFSQVYSLIFSRSHSMFPPSLFAPAPHHAEKHPLCHAFGCRSSPLY